MGREVGNGWRMEEIRERGGSPPIVVSRRGCTRVTRIVRDGNHPTTRHPEAPCDATSDGSEAFSFLVFLLKDFDVIAEAR
jgi:hypothetical protein